MKMTIDKYKTLREQINHDYIRYDASWEEKDSALHQLWLDFVNGMEVGDHASVKLWSDEEPCTVIRRTAKTITVRYDKAELDPNWKPEWIPGGFSAICTNNSEQKWIITEDPNGSTETFRMTKRGWEHNGCRLTPGWHKYYDYNF